MQSVPDAIRRIRWNAASCITPLYESRLFIGDQVSSTAALTRGKRNSDQVPFYMRFVFLSSERYISERLHPAPDICFARPIDPSSVILYQK